MGLGTLPAQCACSVPGTKGGNQQVRAINSGERNQSTALRTSEYLIHKGKLYRPLVRRKVCQATEADGRFTESVCRDPHPRHVTRWVVVVDQPHVAPSAGHVEARLPRRREYDDQTTKIIHGHSTLYLAVPLHKAHSEQAIKCQAYLAGMDP